MKKYKIPEILLICLTIVLITSNCASSKPYKLSEAMPKYAKYEGKSIDPLKDNPVNKPETGIQKYDDFFVKAKKLIIKVQLAKKIAQNKNAAELPDKAELVIEMVSELPELAIDIKKITEDGKNLSSSVKADFMGPNILKLPAVLGELAVTTKELGEAGIAIPQLLVALSSTDESGEGTLTQNEGSNQLTGNFNTNTDNVKSPPIGLNIPNKLNSESKNQAMTKFKSNRIPPAFTGRKETELRLTKNKNNLQLFNEYLVQKKDE